MYHLSSHISSRNCHKWYCYGPKEFCIRLFIKTWLMDVPHLPRSAGQMLMEGRTSSPSADARVNGCNCVWRTTGLDGGSSQDC